MRLRMILVSIALILLNTVVFAHPDHKPRTSYAEAVSRAAPSVVNIYTVRHANGSINTQHYLNRQLPKYKYRLGSGVIMDKRGYILTNYHVIQRSKVILVALSDGRKARAKVIGTDPETDLAVLHIRLKDLKPMVFGDAQKLRVGDVVLAIGNPFGLGQTVTQGIVSAIGRNTIGINQLENYIQTDAAINPGNSGGALVNTLGRLVGINVGIYSRSGGYQGVGFAIPVDVALNIMSQIIKEGRVQRGYLGVNVVTLTLQMANRLGLSQATGVVIRRILKKTPAVAAGLQVGDVITHINNYRVHSARGFMSYIAQRTPGSESRLTLLRGGQTLSIVVKIGKRPPPAMIDDRGRIH